MESLDEKKIAAYLKKNIKPDKSAAGKIFRCSAILSDGTLLACVVFEDAGKTVDGAIRRFDETRNDKTLHKSVGYRATVQSFVCEDNTVSPWDIKELKPCPYAIPGKLIKELELLDETSMGWTEFMVEMDDGKIFRFGTEFDLWFFEMPEGYSGERIVKVSPSKEEGKSRDKAFREKPYFTCYLSRL